MPPPVLQHPPFCFPSSLRSTQVQLFFYLSHGSLRFHLFGVQGKGESLVTWCRSHPFIIMTHTVWLNMIVGQQSSSSDCPVTERPRGFIPWCRSVLVQDTRLTRHGWLLWLKTMNEYPLWDQYYILNDPLCSLAFSHFSEAFTFDTTGLLNLNHSQLLSIDIWICGTPSTLPAAPLILIATTVWE